MICEQCRNEGLTSRVTPGISTTTCLGWNAGYYDEAGVWIASENPNKTITAYTCSNGHSWSETK